MQSKASLRDDFFLLRGYPILTNLYYTLFQFFERFHSIFVHTVCNPFYRLDKEITTKRFQLEITKLVAQTSS